MSQKNIKQMRKLVQQKQTIDLADCLMLIANLPFWKRLKICLKLLLRVNL